MDLLTIGVEMPTKLNVNFLLIGELFLHFKEKYLINFYFVVSISYHLYS